MDPFDPPAVYDDLSTSTLPSQPPLLSRCFGAPVALSFVVDKPPATILPLEHLHREYHVTSY